MAEAAKPLKLLQTPASHIHNAWLKSVLVLPLSHDVAVAGC
jgi:hypothetical protein